MKLLKLVLLAAPLFAFNESLAQTVPLITAAEIRTRITTLVHIATPKVRVTFDTVSKHLTIGNYEIPYRSVSYSYRYISNSYSRSGLVHFARVNCPDDASVPSLEHNCIRMVDAKIDTTLFVHRNGGYYCTTCVVPFATKDDAMTFIGLVGRLK